MIPYSRLPEIYDRNQHERIYQKLHHKCSICTREIGSGTSLILSTERSNVKTKNEKNDCPSITCINDNA